MSSEEGRDGESAQAPVRVFTDEDGVQWDVTEVSGHQVPAARGKHCLIFSSSVAIRRVWTYPKAWHRMSGGELIALSWSR